MKRVICIGLYLLLIGLFIFFYVIYGPKGFLSSVLGFFTSAAIGHWLDRKDMKKGGESDAKMDD